MREFYEKQYARHGHDVRSLGWGGTAQQMNRIKKLIAVEEIKSGPSTWLDVGCGFGDAARFFYVGQYTGIDVNEDFISIAKVDHPACRFERIDLMDYTGKHDYVIASGIFCFKQDAWKVSSAQKLAKLFSICNKAVACNFLTGDGKNPDMHYANVHEVIDMIEPITSKYCIIKNYLPNDFTVYMYKV